MRRISDISRRDFVNAWSRACESRWNIEQLAKHLNITVQAVRGRRCYYESNHDLKFPPLKKVERPRDKKEKAVLQAILNNGARRK